MMKPSCALMFLAVVLAAGSLNAAPLEQKASAALARATPAQIQAFFSSVDYTKRHSTDADFLTDLFHGVLQREPDAVGYQSWIATLQRTAKDPRARENAVATFLKSPEYLGSHSPKPTAVKKAVPPRNPGNALFSETGVFVNSATAMPFDRFATFLKKGGVVWIAIQIDNGGEVRKDNVTSIEAGWLKAWRDAGFKVGFWGCPRGASQHNSQAAITDSIPRVQTDAVLAVNLTVKYRGDFYIADCEDGYQGYNPKDSAPSLNRVYVDAFQSAAKAAGIGTLPRALSSMGRVALDMQPWIAAGWDALPQAYWNSYAVYQPSKCVDFYVNDAGWPIERIHPTIATYTGEGEKRTVSLEDYAADLKTRSTRGFSYYLPESYLLFNESLYTQLAKMASH